MESQKSHEFIPVPNRTQCSRSQSYDRLTGELHPGRLETEIPLLSVWAGLPECSTCPTQPSLVPRRPTADAISHGSSRRRMCPRSTLSEGRTSMCHCVCWPRLKGRPGRAVSKAEGGGDSRGDDSEFGSADGAGLPLRSPVYACLEPAGPSSSARPSSSGLVGQVECDTPASERGRPHE